MVAGDSSTTVSAPEAEREIVLTRVFDAPRTRVFKAWTDPAQVGRWWGPAGFTNTVIEMDVRPGGVWRFIMHGPDGVDYKNRVVYDEVAPPECLVYTHDDDGEDESPPFHVTVTFAEQDGKTTLTMRSRFITAAERDRVVTEYGAIEGAHQMLDRLTAYLTG